MASQVISFRLSEDAIAILKEKALPGESDSQAAQRLMNELLGTAKNDVTGVDARIQEAIAPIYAELEEIKAQIKKGELEDLGKALKSRAA